jgi:acylpyruvate hydrolase
MKIVVYGPQRRTGAMTDEGIVDISGAFAKFAHEVRDEPLPYALATSMAPANLNDFILAGPRAIENTTLALEYLAQRAADKKGIEGEDLVADPASVRIHAPLAHPGVRIGMSGGNFPDHSVGIQRRRRPNITIEEIIPEYRANGMWGYWKLPANVIGPTDDLTYPSRTQRLDYEAEVTIVLGKAGKNLTPDRLDEYIWGYTMQVDWSLRDQREPRDLKYNIGKNFDGSSSLGPCIVVGEIANAADVPFETHVNGELRQKGNTCDMIFSFGEYLEYLTRDNTMRPGDMISAGTCAGTAADASEVEEGGGLSPKLFLRPGDFVEISSPLIGTIRTRIVSGQEA